MPIFKQLDGKLVPGGPDALEKHREKKRQVILKAVEKEVKRLAATKKDEDAAKIAKIAAARKPMKKAISKVKGKSSGRQKKTKNKREKT